MLTRLGSTLKKPGVLLALRIIIGVLFALAGFLKLIHPWQEFAAQIRTYQVIGGASADLAAQVIPWFQLIFGSLLVAGVFPRISLAVINGMLALFIPVVASTVIRGLDLSDCGCFGGIGIKETAPVVLVRDGVTVLMSVVLWRAWGLGPPKDLEADAEVIPDSE